MLFSSPVYGVFLLVTYVVYWTLRRHRLLPLQRSGRHRTEEARDAVDGEVGRAQVGAESGQQVFVDAGSSERESRRSI